MFLSQRRINTSSKNQHILSLTYLQSHRLSQRVQCERNGSPLQHLPCSAPLYNAQLFLSSSYSRLLPCSLATEKQAVHVICPLSRLTFWPSGFPLYLVQNQYWMSLLVPLTFKMPTPLHGFLFQPCFAVTNNGSFTMQGEREVLDSSIPPPVTSRYRAEAQGSKIFCFSNSECVQLSFM